MKLNLTKGQYDKLADLAMDLAKGILVSSFAVPLFDHSVTWIKSLFSILEGLIFIIVALILEKYKEKLK